MAQVYKIFQPSATISLLHSSSKKKEDQFCLCYLNIFLCTWQAFAVISDGVSWEKAGLRAAPTC